MKILIITINNSFAENLEAHIKISKMKMSIGSTVKIEAFDEFFIPDPDMFQVHVTMAHPPSGVSSQYLAKIWNIKEDLSQRALDQTAHHYRQGTHNELSQRLSINDRMLHYNIINIQFYTDTLFVTGKGKPTRRNTRAQLVVSDKGFV